MEEVNSTNNKARSKMKKTERRTFTVRNIEARQAEDGTMRMALRRLHQVHSQRHFKRHQMFVYWLITKDCLWPEPKTVL
jgi:hypothetical protein